MRSGFSTDHENNSVYPHQVDVLLLSRYLKLDSKISTGYRWFLTVRTASRAGCAIAPNIRLASNRLQPVLAPTVSEVSNEGFGCYKLAEVPDVRPGP